MGCLSRSVEHQSLKPLRPSLPLTFFGKFSFPLWWRGVDIACWTQLVVLLDSYTIGLILDIEKIEMGRAPYKYFLIHIDA